VIAGVILRNQKQCNEAHKAVILEAAEHVSFVDGCGKGSQDQETKVVTPDLLHRSHFTSTRTVSSLGTEMHWQLLRKAQLYCATFVWTHPVENCMQMHPHFLGTAYLD
jgi:hypothetical protein